jgi:Mg2+ and Co2+ transporter CorA
VPGTSREGSAFDPRRNPPHPVWIDLGVADRERLAELGRRVGLPLELITYSLLNQERPKIVPCATWLYCVWQVPVVTARPSASGDETALRLVEIKLCLGPTTVITMHARGQRAPEVLPGLLSDGFALIRRRVANLLTTLIERIGDTHLSVHKRLAGRTFAQRRLLRQVRAHRMAVERLTHCGRRWLDVTEIERLDVAARRLERLETVPSRSIKGNQRTCRIESF